MRQIQWKSERGQSLIELGLVLPFLLLVLLGIIDFGRILITHQMISEAARDGTRYASVGSATSVIGQAIQNDTQVLGTGVEWSVSPAGVLSSGSTVTVSVKGAVPIIDPVMMAIVGSQVSVTSSFTMRVE